MWIVLAALGTVVILNIGVLGSDPWRFRPGAVAPQGPLGFVVRLADSEWNLGFLRSIAMIAGVGIVVLATIACLVRAWRPWVLVAACFLAITPLVLPAVALQVGLRDATAPWFFTNDSTYQLELAGDLVLDGKSPYGHDFTSSGLERFYSLDGTVSAETVRREVALRHFAYFPGAALFSAAWRLLPSPFDDVRVLVALATLGLLGAALVFPGPLWARLSLGVLLAANPIVVRAAWFGTNDAPTLLLLVLAFVFAVRRRPGWAGVALGGAILTKQFALVAVPFLALMMSAESRRSLGRFAATTGAVLVAGFLPFVAASPRAVWEDTVTYGTGTYRIVGYGLPALLVRGDIIDDRYSSYPFFALCLLVWLPVTLLLLREQRRTSDSWFPAAGFTVSMFLLLFLGRVFQISYLVYPLTGILLAGLLLVASRAVPERQLGAVADAEHHPSDPA